MNKKKVLRASQSNIWLNCPGSIQFESSKNILQNNDAAVLGTLIHQYCESKLKNKKNTDKQFRKKLNIKEEEIFIKNKELYEKMSNYYNNIIDILLEELKTQKLKPSLLIEKSYKYKNIQGTVDLIIIAKRGEKVKKILVIDLKTGFINVESQDNTQLKIYSNLILNDLLNSNQIKQNELKNIEVEGIIIQPKLNSFKRSKINVEKNIKTYLNKVINQTINSSKLKTGEQCTYCQYNDICPLFKKRIKEFLNVDFNDKKFNRIENWAEYLDLMTPIQKMLDKIKQNCKDYMREGFELPGYRLDYKAGKRSWLYEIDEKKLNDIIGNKKIKQEDLYEKKLLPPKQILELLTKKLTKKQIKEVEERLTEIIVQPKYQIIKKDKIK